MDESLVKKALENPEDYYVKFKILSRSIFYENIYDKDNDYASLSELLSLEQFIWFFYKGKPLGEFSQEQFLKKFIEENNGELIYRPSLV